MVEEHSKTLYDVDLITAKLGNPPSWASEGLTPTNAGRNLAIVIPKRLDLASKQRIASEEYNPDFEIGKIIAITLHGPSNIAGKVIGAVNICPFNVGVMSWDKLKAQKGEVITDEIKNGLLARLYGRVGLNREFMHPDVLARMPRKWHQHAEILNAELDGMFASGIEIKNGEMCWTLSEEVKDSD